jgi:hypothetical protein
MLFITVSSGIFYLLNLLSVWLLISMACSVSLFLLWHVILFGGIFITGKHILLTYLLSATPVLAALPAQQFFTLHACFGHNRNIQFSPKLL